MREGIKRGSALHAISTILKRCSKLAAARLNGGLPAGMNSTRSNLNRSAASLPTIKCARWMGSKVPPKIAILIFLRCAGTREDARQQFFFAVDFQSDLQPVNFLRRSEFHCAFSKIHAVLFRGDQRFGSGGDCLAGEALNIGGAIGVMIAKRPSKYKLKAEFFKRSPKCCRRA